jgi:hypothetical protein
MEYTYKYFLPFNTLNFKFPILKTSPISCYKISDHRKLTTSSSRRPQLVKQPKSPF